MAANFVLPPTLVRKLGFLFNGGQHNGWTNRVSQLLGVAPRTVEAWARGERECAGPPALLMAHLARMIVNQTYSDVSLDEINQIVESHENKTSINFDLPEVRIKIRSIIKLHSSIKRVSEDLNINRSALSRWLSGESALGVDSVTKVLDYIGLNRNLDAGCERTWHVSLAEYPDNELIEDIRGAIDLFFPGAPDCLIIQEHKPVGRSAKIIAGLLHKNTKVNIEFKIPLSFVQSDKFFEWLSKTFASVHSTAFYCTVNSEDDLEKYNNSGGKLDTV
jgi:transcriptional regulator with XRE-family HTH domain